MSHIRHLYLKIRSQHHLHAWFSERLSGMLLLFGDFVCSIQGLPCSSIEVHGLSSCFEHRSFPRLSYATHALTSFPCVAVGSASARSVQGGMSSMACAPLQISTEADSGAIDLPPIASVKMRVLYKTASMFSGHGAHTACFTLLDCPLDHCLT